MDGMVNSPSHYQLDGMEVIDIIKAVLTPEEYRGFLKGNDLKYIFREPHKGNPAQDVSKHIWYAQRYHDALLEERKTMSLEGEMFDLLRKHGWQELAEPTMDFLCEQGYFDLCEDEKEQD